MTFDIAAAEARLGEYDFVFVIDTSGSMQEPVKAGNPNGMTRWQSVQETAISLARDITKIDADGIGLVLFGGSSVQSFDGCGTDKVKEAFAAKRPSGSTPLAEALTAAFALAGKSEKKDCVVVFTDGVPDDKSAAANVIRKHSNAQETDDACTVLFVQVGDDASATSYLKSLDDSLTGAKFDIVDVKTVAEVDQYSSAVELIVDAING